ncbi:MAG: hypothetical protein AB7U61_10565 [Methylocystis sp.]
MAQDEYVNTPFGMVPKECYRQHPAGTTLQEIPNGVRANHADGTTQDYISTEKCIAFGKAFKAFKGSSERSAATPAPIAHGWFNYASWTSPQGVGKFTAAYKLPRLPANPGPQYVYYFIGAQSEAGILQPVIGYNQIGGAGWTLSSWYCCPKGTVNQGNVVSGMGPEDVIQASIVQTSQSPSTYSITGVWRGNAAGLNVVVGSEVFNWPNVTLEAYGVYSCDQLMTGPFTFSKLAMTGVDGNPMKPDWALSPPPKGFTACDGKLSVNGGMVTIEENGVN